MSKLQDVLKRIASVKAKVQKDAKFDKKNLADEVRTRSPLVAYVVAHTKMIMDSLLRTEIEVQPENTDINRAATLATQEFVFTATAGDASGNLLSLEIIESDQEAISIRKNKISIYTEDGVSDHDSIKALIEADSQASAMISVEINSGEGATLVVASELAQFTGAV